MDFVSIINPDGVETDFQAIKEKQILTVAQNDKVVRVYISDNTIE